MADILASNALYLKKTANYPYFLLHKTFSCTPIDCVIKFQKNSVEPEHIYFKKNVFSFLKRWPTEFLKIRSASRLW